MSISSSQLDKDAPALVAYSDEADSRLVARIRLMLAISALLIAVVDRTGPVHASAAALIILSTYCAFCTVAYIGGQCRLPFTRGRLMHRLDAAVFVAMAAAGGEADIFPLVFLFFAIVVASLRFGLDEGARVTIVALLFYCMVIARLPHVAPARLFLRAAVLLAFGRAIAQLGERHLQAARRQALLRDLNQVANPRFGIDRTMTAALERIRVFFMADSCIALIEEHDSGRHAIRTVRAGSPPAAHPTALAPELACAMLPEPRGNVVLYARPWRRWRRLAATALGHAGGGHDCWTQLDEHPLQQVADLLEAESFISAPLVFGRGKGRIYIAAGTRHLNRGDAMLLVQIAANELVAIDRIDLLDRIASDAAAHERKRIALDLHDTAIQSYIGLQLGLAALSRKAAPTNPLVDDLDKLVAMAADVVMQLRDVAQGACRGGAGGEPMFLAALRVQAAQAMAAYGVDITINTDASVAFGDRLMADVLQIVREGISNICRHTDAKRAAVSLRCSDGVLRIDVSNEHGRNAPPPFHPRSISERAATLGGAAYVRQGRFNNTIVCVEIPL